MEVETVPAMLSSTEEKAAPGSSSVVEVKNLVYAYTGAEYVAIKVHDFRIRDGEAVLIVGKSGSGKSTLVNCINGVIPHIFPGDVADLNPVNTGQVSVLGQDVATTKLAKMSSLVGTLLQDPETQVLNYRVQEEVAFGPENLCLPRDEIAARVDEATKTVGLEPLLEKETYTLSGGELQRVALAGVLAMRPKILIFDEPTSNIDPEGTAAIFEFLKTIKGKTMIIVEHKVERVLPFVDRIVLVDNGEVALDIHKSELLENLDTLVKAGVEIPEHYLLAKQLGLDTVDVLTVRSSLRERGMTLPKPSRVNSTDRILEAKMRVSARNRVLLDASLQLNRGEVYAIMGRNGAGKSTMLKAIMGFLDRQLSSEITLHVEGVELSHSSMAERGRHVYYVPQSFDLTLVSSTVRDELAYSMKKKGVKDWRPRVSELLNMFSLTPWSNGDPLTLSMGQRRRVAMASALASGAHVILLDEPTSGQDFYHRESLGQELAKLKSMGYTFLVVTHDSRFVYRHADRMGILMAGAKVSEGFPEEVFATSEDYGIPAPTDYLLRR